MGLNNICISEINIFGEYVKPLDLCKLDSRRQLRILYGSECICCICHAENIEICNIVVGQVSFQPYWSVIKAQLA